MNEASDSGTCLYHGCTQNLGKKTGDYGYWTSTSLTGYSSSAWHVNSDGILSNGSVDINYFGIRPVITLSS